MQSRVAMPIVMWVHRSPDAWQMGHGHELARSYHVVREGIVPTSTSELSRRVLTVGL